MASQIITILGATGTQGASVCDTFSAIPGWSIRAITRNLASQQAQELKLRRPSIELVQADTNDTDSLRRAFSRSTAIFAVTDYWAPFKDSKVREEHATGSNPAESLRRWAFDEEVKQGRNIADAAAATLVAEGKLERFIFSSLPSTTKYSKGKYSRIYHFDSKAVIEDYIKETHSALAKKMNVIYIGFYVSNMLLSPMMRPIKLQDGSFLIQRLCEEHARHPFILTRTDTGPLVRVLIEYPETGRNLLAYTAMLSWGEMAQLWGKALSQKVQFRQITVEEFKKKFPMDGEELLSANYSAEFGFAGRDPAILEPRNFGLEDRPKDVEKWFGEQDWRGVLDANADEDLRL